MISYYTFIVFNFYNTIFLKRQFVYFIRARALAKQRKIDIKNNTTTVTFENQAIEGL